MYNIFCCVEYFNSNNEHGKENYDYNIHNKENYIEHYATSNYNEQYWIVINI